MNRMQVEAEGAAGTKPEAPATAADIRDILAILDDERDVAGPLAIDIAVSSDAHVTALSLVGDLPLLGSGFGVLPTEVIVEARNNALARAAASTQEFERRARVAQIGFATQTAQNVSFGGFEDVLDLARLTDLVVVRRDDALVSTAMRTALVEALLFDSATPLLLAPPRVAQGSRLRRALIAWDGTSGSARALKAALPMLARCIAVDVVIADASERLRTLSAIENGTFLGRHRIQATVRHLPVRETSVAETILRAAEAAGSDWIVMGAYGHARFREHLFGGATFDVLRDAPVPVLMAH